MDPFDEAIPPADQPAHPPPGPTLESRLIGCLLGTALGDAIGLPYEGLSRPRARRLLGPPTRHRLLMGRGMVSDDTEHSCLVAQALIASGGDPEAFRGELAKGLRWWLLGLPAGIGLATLRATLKLWAGVPPTRSGVFSAGNGPAMRSTILGAAIEDLNLLQELVAANTDLTHTDPRAREGAHAVALAAWLASRPAPVDAEAYLVLLEQRLETDGELLAPIRQAVASAQRGETTNDFATELGLERGVSGYVLHTVPVALHAWLSSPGDLRLAVQAVIECGGDADTTAAIVGGLVGARVGRDGLPADWLEGLWEWPRNRVWIEGLGRQLARHLIDGSDARPPSLPVAGLVLRNLLFLLVVLLHGLRRWLPPY